MRLRALLALPLLLVSLVASAQDSVYRRRASAVAETKQWIFGNVIPSLPTSAATRYYPLSGTTTSTVATAASTRGAPYPAGTLNHLWGMTHTDSANDIGDGNTVTFTVYKNGSSTGLTCTITASAGNPPYDHLCAGTPINSPVTVAEGDYLEMEVSTTTGSSLSAGLVGKWAVQFDPTNDNEFVYTSGVSWGAVPAAGQNFRGLGWFTTNSSAESLVRWVVPTDGTFTKLLVRNDADQSTGQFRVEMLQNTTLTSLACNISSGKTCSATANVSVAAGDVFSLKAKTESNGACTAASTPFACCTGAGTGSGCTSYTSTSGDTGVTLLFTPTTRGRYWFANSGNITVNASAARYGPLLGNRQWTATQYGEFGFGLAEFKDSGLPLLTLHSMLARTSEVGMGEGQSFTFDLWEAPAHTTTASTANSRGSCTIDEDTCAGAAPCTCTADISAEVPRSNAQGASVYEFRALPAGTPGIPYVQTAIEVGQ